MWDRSPVVNATRRDCLGCGNGNKKPRESPELKCERGYWRGRPLVAGFIFYGNKKSVPDGTFFCGIIKWLEEIGSLIFRNLAILRIPSI